MYKFTKSFIQNIEIKTEMFIYDKNIYNNRDC